MIVPAPHHYFYISLLTCLGLLVLILRYHLYHSFHYGLKQFGAILLLLAIMVTSISLVVVPKPQLIGPQIPLFSPLDINYHHPLMLEFNRPLRQNPQIQITPTIDGQLTQVWGKFGPLKSVYQFTPRASLIPGTEYIIEVSNITGNPLHQPETITFTLQAPAIPQVSQLSPLDGQTAFRTDHSIHLQLDQEIPEGIRYTAQLSPQVPLTLSIASTGRDIIIHPEKTLNQNTTYQLTVSQSIIQTDFITKTSHLISDFIPIANTSFTTVKPALIDSISPSNTLLLPDQPIEINFAQAMNRSTAQAITLTPEIPHSTIWESDTMLKLVPQSTWPLDQDFNIHITTTALTTDGGQLPQPISHSLHTIGDIQVIKTSPVSNTTTHAPTDPITIYFDQPIIPPKLTDISIFPSVPLAIQSQTNTLTLTPQQPLTSGTVYTLTIHHLSSPYQTKIASPFSLTFTATPQDFRLQVPQHFQQHSFTCFSAATQMVLDYYQAPVASELDISQAIGYQAVPRNFLTNTWGDPNQGIVGSFDGSGSGGYGAHWQPVAKYISQFRPTQVVQNATITQILESVSQGHPVMVWWVNGVWPARDTSWQTPDGQQVYTVNGMHVEVVTGWKGNIQDPQSIYTNDPWRGARTYTPAQFQALWKWFNNTALIVR